jgi:hypothetical protein
MEQQVGDMLHDSGRVGRVVPSSVLGTQLGAPEDALTSRALKLPIDAVVVVRGSETPTLVAVYRDGTRRGPTPLWFGTGKPPVAPETAHASEPAVASPATPASAVATLSTPPSAPAPRSDAPAPAAEATPPPPPAVQQPVPPPDPTPTPPPVERRSPEQAQSYYDASYIGFREFGSVRKTEPYEGRYQRLLTWPEFYQKVGRRDLVDRAHTRLLWHRGLIATGVIVSVGGLIAIAAQAGVNACSGIDCHPGLGGEYAGMALTGAGLGFVLGGSFVSTKVEPAWEARRMGEGYNAWLKEQLAITK